VTVAGRLRIIAELMDRDDVLSFVPTIQLFIDRHPPDQLAGEESRLFEEIRRSDPAREKILGLVQELDVSALQLELAHFARHLGWLSPRAFRALAVDAAGQLLRRPLTSEVVDVMCEIPRHESLRDEFGSADLSSALFDHPEGIRLVDCLSPSDPLVTDRLAASLDRPDPTTRLWAAYALSRRLPLFDAILVRLATDLDDPSNDMRERVRWILRAQAPLSNAVRQAVAARDPGLADALAPEPPRKRGFFW
jgi:hypothetical protein